MAVPSFVLPFTLALASLLIAVYFLVACFLLFSSRYRGHHPETHTNTGTWTD